MNEKMFLSIVNGENKEILNENANMPGETPAGIMYKLAAETSKEHSLNCLVSEEAKQAVEGNYLHIHDLDFYPTKSTTCLQHPLNKILEHGFVANDGQARPCKRIETAGALAAITMQTIQNEQHGGQSIPAFDFYLAPYVRATFEEELEKAYKMGKNEGFTDISREQIEEMVVEEYVDRSDYPILKRIAVNNTVKRVHQTMEAFIHNMNTMRSRGGGQTVFSSINYGTDTSPEGRCVIRELLKATDRGVGNNTTAIFPIQIWKLKKGVSAEEGDPNYDLLQEAYKVTAKRFFPNFINLDAPFNQHEKWDVNDPERYKYEVATMGCRTRVFENRCGEKTSIGRGNLSFTTINLVRLALESAKETDDLEKRKEIFFEKLNHYVDVATGQLLSRYMYQYTGLKKQFPLLMSGMWEGSDKLKPDDNVGEVLRQGTLSVGFIGLAECLIALTGKHHGEDKDSQKLGLEIVTAMNEKCKEWAEYYQLNISVIATPAEGLSGKFVKKDREDFGVIENVTDRDYYTNSNHIPVWYKCTMNQKMKIEAPYHALTPAGHIAYLEVDGNPEKNIKAVEQMVNLMRKYNIGYGSINHARARCLDCGHESGSDLFDTCPKCNSTNVDMLERVTGYLVGSVSRWNNGKKAELKDRVSHTSGKLIVKNKQI